MNYLSTGRLPTDRHLSLIPQMEQHVFTNLYKRNVLFLKPEDVTTRNGEVFTPNLMTLSKLRRSEQFKKDVVFSDNMSGNDVRCRLEELFPELINKRFSCAARENKDSSRLEFHGDRRVWDGITMRRKLRGASAMYIVLEDEISQVPASTVTSGGTTGAAESGNNNYQYNPLDNATVTDAFPPDLKDVNPGRFEMDWKDVMDVLEEDVKKSEQVDSRRSETGLHITRRFAVIQKHNKLRQVPSAAAQGSKRYDPGYVSSADSSSQEQELYQGTAMTNDNNRKRSEGPAAASRTSQRRQTSFSSEEGSSSQDKELDREAAAAIFPKSGPVKGGTLFSLHNLQVDGSVTYLLATFGAKQVGITPEPDGGNSWLGRTPRGEKPGEVTVVVVSKETGAYLGETIFTYEPEDEKKTANKQSVSSKRELENYSSVDLLDELKRRLKKAKKDYYSEENGISNNSQQQGMPNRAKLLQLQDNVKSLVYVAAERGARELIEELCSLSAGKIVFEACKSDCPLPENIAEDNGHKEIAAFLKGITKRYSEEYSTSPGQPEDVDWLVLAKAFEEINLIQSDPSSDQDLRQISEDNISETGYSGDGETSSSNSERDSCDSDDEYEVCKGNPVSFVHEEGEVLLESPILHFEADSSCSSLLELQRTTSEDEEIANCAADITFFANSYDLLFEDFDKWFSDPGDSRVYVLLGDAGIGESVMAGALAPRTKNNGQLGNSVSAVHEEGKVLLESPVLHFEADSSCSSLLELQRTTSENEELMEHTIKAGHFSAGETKNDSRHLGSVADCNNSVEEEKEGETQHGNESYLEGESYCACTDRSSCDSLELPRSDLEGKMQRTSHEEMLEPMRKAGHLRRKDVQYLGGVADYNSQYSNTEERKKEDKLQHGYESFLEGECCYASVKGPPCGSLEPLTNADSDDKIQGKPDQGESFGENVSKPSCFGLPNRVPKFVGRKEVCEKITRLMTYDDTSLITLVAPSGFGKTAAAIDVGYMMLEKGKDVLYLCLRTVTSVTLAAKNLLNMVGIPVGDNPVLQVKRYLASLDNETVLVLDNAEDLQIGDESAFNQLLQKIGQYSNNLVIIITSRNPLSKLDFPFLTNHIKLKPLDEESSFFFLKHYAHGISDQLASFFAKPRVCGGIPLLLKLTASFLETKTIDPRELLGKLENCPHSFLKAKDANSRELHFHFFYFQVFYNHLPPKVKKGLSALAAFPAIFTKEEAKTVLFPNEDFQLLLNKLVSHSLVQQDEVNNHLQYGLHPLVQTFCIASRENSCKGYNIAIRLFSGHYLALLRRLNDDFISTNCKIAIHEYHLNKANIVHALLSSTEDDFLKCYVVGVSTETVNFLAKVMNKDEFFSLYDKFLAVAKAMPDQTLYSDCLVSIGFKQLCYYGYEDAYLTEAKGNLEKAHDLQNQLGINDTECQAHCKCKLGLCIFVAGDKKKGISLIAQGIGIRLKLARSDGSGKMERMLLAGGFCDLGMAMFVSKKYKAAANIWENICLVRYRELLGTHPFTATLLDHIGKVYQQLGQHKKAVAFKKESLAMRYFLFGEDHLDTARAYYGLGCALKRLGCTEEALENLIRARDIQIRVLASKHDMERTEQEINARTEIPFRKIQLMQIANYGVSCHGVC